MKKLLLLLLIAVVGAGIAFGANAAFFSTASDDRPLIEPRGLVDGIVASNTSKSDRRSSAPPSPSPKAEPKSSEGASTARVSTEPNAAAPVPAPVDDGPGPRTPRSPSGSRSSPEPTAMVVQGIWDEQGDPEHPCDAEESERDRRRCENEMDREEQEAEDDAENG